MGTIDGTLKNLSYTSLDSVLRKNKFILSACTMKHLKQIFIKALTLNPDRENLFVSLYLKYFHVRCISKRVVYDDIGCCCCFFFLLFCFVCFGLFCFFCCCFFSLEDNVCSFILCSDNSRHKAKHRG